MKRIERWAVGLTLVAAIPVLLPAQPVPAPSGVTVTSNGTTLTVSWNNMTGVGAYQVNRRQPQQLLASITRSPYTTALPQAGVYYEYQVVSVGKNKTAASSWVGYTVPTSSTTTGVIVTEPRPGGTLTVIPAGPSWVTAGSGIPGQILVKWGAVANATAYRVMRSSNAPEAETKIAEYSSTSQLAEGGLWQHNDAPVDLRWTYTYKVFALFGTTVSTASPIASAKSIAVVQPTNLKYGVTLVPNMPGRVNVTLSWTAAPNAVQYAISGTGFSGIANPVVSGTSYTVSNVLAGSTYRVCVGAVYPYSIGDPSTAPCIDVKLQ